MGRWRRRASTVPPHRHDPLPGEPADVLERQVCSGPEGCGLLGKPGDVHHPVGGEPLSVARARARSGRARPSAYLQEAARERDAAILGERDADD
ncbi:hypothetical protein M3G91_01770 [Micromonospora chalcea]|uniref:hypothetical protein n=1 Tax=Micromonospora chalcea TaxID=1874 RepID=UPI0021A44CC7|nr:hypothetical protein [Micromonospora chalcea]MCT2276337.1 hypothetical protein [Micromonospora chalcea]